MRRPLRCLLIVLLLLSAACQDQRQPTAPTVGNEGQPSSAATPEHPISSGAPNGTHRDVTFAAGDGEKLSGRLFGAGSVGVVLSHMGRPGDGPDDWQSFAEMLAADGYLVLTYTERSGLSEVWRDVIGGTEFLRDHGATTVIAAGASIGAMSSLYAAGRPDSGINAVLWLAGVLDNSGYSFTESDVAGLRCPLMIISGADDPYDAGPDARKLHRWTTDVSELVIVPSQFHGTDMLSRDSPKIIDRLETEMLAFVDSVAEREPDACADR